VFYETIYFKAVLFFKEKRGEGILSVKIDIRSIYTVKNSIACLFNFDTIRKKTNIINNKGTK